MIEAQETSLSKYERLTKETRDRYREFEVIKEYEAFYLCGKYDEDGKLMYKECFLKKDIDGIPKQRLSKHIPFLGRWGK